MKIKLYIILIFLLILISIIYLYREYKLEAEVQKYIDKLKNEEKLPNDEFNSIPKYYINLDRSQNRRLYMKNHIKDYKVENIQRFPAIDGKNLPSMTNGEINGVKYFNNINCKYSPSQLAITLSHLECMRRGGETGHFPFMIMEDDVSFMLINKNKKGFNKIIEDTPKEVDFLHLFNYKELKEGYHINKGDSGAVCYIVFEQGYHKLMDKLYIDGIWTFTKGLNIKDIIIDSGIKTLYNHGKYFPSLILQSLEGESTHEGKNNGDKMYRKMLKNNIKFYL